MAPESFVQNFSDVNSDWNTAGYGFSETEAKVIHASLQKLAAEYRVEKIAFLGIVKGTAKDYFVAYGRLSSYPNDILPDNWEKQGVGVNGVTFWVASHRKPRA